MAISSSSFIRVRLTGVAVTYMGKIISKCFWKIRWLLTPINLFIGLLVCSWKKYLKKKVSNMSGFYIGIEERDCVQQESRRLGSRSVWQPLKGENVLTREVLSSKVTSLVRVEKGDRANVPGGYWQQREGHLVRPGRGVCLVFRELKWNGLEYSKTARS